MLQMDSTLTLLTNTNYEISPHIRPTGVIGTEFQYRFFDSDGVDFICAGVSGEPFEVTVPLDEIGVMQYRDTLDSIHYREIAPVAGDTLFVDYLPATRI